MSKKLTFLVISIILFSLIPIEMTSGSDIDLSLPLGFESISPSQSSVIYDDHFDLKGRLKDSFQAKLVKFKGEPVEIVDNGFEIKDIRLKEGVNTFLIDMTDINGKRRLVSYSVSSEKKKLNLGGGSLVETVAFNSGLTAEGYSEPGPRRKALTVVTTSYTPPQYQSSASQYTASSADVVFTSPYFDQVITENKLKIGGRFNKDAGISSITVNGQSCTLDKTAGTFEGPMLVSPGEARRKKINSDSAEYIIMKVNPENHSGKNELKVVIKPEDAKAYEDRVEYYYYQMFVKLNTCGKSYMWGSAIKMDEGGMCLDIFGPEAEIPYSYTQVFNQDLSSEIPFENWEYENYNGRLFEPEYEWYYLTTQWQGKYWYSDKAAFIFAMDSYWNLKYKDSFSFSSYSIPVRSLNDTNLIVHTPPFSNLPFIIVLKDCDFLETSEIFADTPDLDISNYKINGIPLRSLCGDFKKRTSSDIDNAAYIVIDNYEPDVDITLNLETPQYMNNYEYEIFAGGHKIIQPITCNKYFYCDVKDGITGDILIDSNNDGFLGGEDNAVEQNEPGCVFWVNDDDESSESIVHPDDPDAAVDEFDKDCEDDAINGIRDLEDFMPFDLTIPNISEWANTQNVKFYLKAEGQGKIRVFKRINDAYLTELRYSRKQFVEKIKIFISSGSDTDKEGQLLDPAWFDSNGKFYGIFEGVREGPLKLILEVQLGEGDNKKKVVLDEARLTLKNVRDMYRFIDVRDGPTLSNADNKLRYRNINVKKNNMIMDDPSSVTFFIHGASTSEEDAIEWSGIVYKRLYRTGYRGGFIGLSWHSDENIKFINPKTVFDNQWVNSFQTGQVLSDVIIDTKKEFKDAKINLIAHSLGGNLTSYALRLLAAQGQKELVNNVFLIQAAVPGNAYGGFVGSDYFKDMYFLSAGNSITGKMYNFFYSKDKLLDEFRKDISGASYSTLIGKAGLPIPLNNCYELLPANEMQSFLDLNAYRHEKSKSGALGRQGIRSDLPNFESYYRKFKTVRPYGIRDHLSFGTEYYYDVKEYYGDMINSENMEE